MSILVTGATGFTGTALCRRLAAESITVTAFVRRSSDTSALEQSRVNIKRVDIEDTDDIRRNFAGIEIVYHLAAAWRVEHSDLREFQRVNVEATRNLLEVARENRVNRFVHCSTVGVQGHIDDPPADEEYRYAPGDHYQETKMEGEKLALHYFSNGLPGVVVRPAGIYGPGDTRFLKLFRPINRRMFVMIGSGEAFYHFTYIDDLVQGLLLAGSRPEAIGEIFTVAGEEYISLKRLVDLIADVLEKSRPSLRVPFFPVYKAAVVCDRFCRYFGIEPPLYPRRVDFFRKDRAFSIEKAKRVLGYRPKTDLKEGLMRTAQWYRENGYIK
jgi:nucleoside-diphosphate-sugar epimerase